MGQAPQSATQVEHFSAPLQVPSPHTGAQVPQSVAQVEHVSVPLQVPSPHTGAQTPQSPGQEAQVSVPVAQVWSPQTGLRVPWTSMESK